MTKVLSVLLLTFFISVPTFGAKGDCKAERKAICGHCEKGDRSCFKSCMKENKSKLSEQCRKHRKERRKAKRNK